MNGSRRGQILAAYLGLAVGSGLVLAYFLRWQIGVPVVCLGLGSVLLLYASNADEKDRTPAPVFALRLPGCYRAAYTGGGL